MRKRLYFLHPDHDSAKRAMDELLLARIEVKHIHFMARDGTNLTGLHEANLLQSSDILHGAGAGLRWGGMTGLLIGLGMIFAPIEGIPHGAAALVTFLFGAVFGCWVASMVGSSLPNSHIKPFEVDIANGKILLMVDVPIGRVAEIESMLQRMHPEAEDRGLDPVIPAFP
ncbi:hypothetical protein GCM10007907_22810 [Chitinimonas prasina]|uniref:DUF1269 domain-containing protein n=1 Tax=Chitinimonas prasina TaxID=1434937 RepID=A0ABQ5YES8_9NEIS|nr:DUF1269 domain-containing protein [Chitinimonas prasina]GLR13491.1 hypothetical protein GCM10007907_22810 [Chitinimonas prasina]